MLLRNVNFLLHLLLLCLSAEVLNLVFSRLERIIVMHLFATATTAMVVNWAHLVLRELLSSRLLLIHHTKLNVVLLLMNAILRWADRLDQFRVMVADIDHFLLRKGSLVTHHGVLVGGIVQLRSVNALTIEEADELVLVASLLLHLGLQALDSDRFELAEGRLEPAPVDTGRDHRRSQHLWCLFTTFALLLAEGVAGVAGLSRADLFLVLASLG